MSTERPSKARVAAGLCGVLPALAFPEVNAPWLGVVGLVPVLLIVARAPNRKEALVRGWLAGTAYFIVAGHWLVPNVGPGLVLFAGLLATSWLPWAGVAWGTLRAERTPAALAGAIALVPAAWVVGEFLRSWEYLGGPWALIGAAQWDNRFLLPLAAYGGVWLVSFVVVALAVGISSAFLPGQARRARTIAVLSVAGVATCSIGLAATAPAPESERAILVAGVQPGPGLARSERLSRALAATEGLRPERADLVVWGESSVGYDLAEGNVADRLVASSVRVDAPLLANVDARRGAGGIFKSSVLVDRSGVAVGYDKIRLVPFGEYIPLRPVLGWLGSVSEASEEDRSRGEALVVMDAAGARIGPLICFESTFPDMARNLARMGAEVIIVQSSTSTFQESWAPEQHASLAAIRAVETGRSVVHATLTGVSVVFDPSGRRLAWVPTDRRGAYVVEVPLSTYTTPYVRSGDWVPLASFLLLGIHRLVGRISRARSRLPT